MKTGKFSFFTGISCPLLFLAALLIIFPATSFSQGIRIIDCRGNTRALKQQLQATDNSVKVDVVEQNGQPVENAKLKLANGNGEVMYAAAQNGLVEFINVSPGVWMLTSEQPGVFFTSISLSDSIIPPFWDRVGDFLGQTGKIILVTGAVVGAAVLVDHASDGNGGGDESVTPPVTGCPACNPDESAPSIPAFQ